MAGNLRKLGLKVAMAGLQSYRSGVQSINKGNEATRRSMGDVAQGSKKLDLGLAALTGGMQALASKGIDLLLGGLKKLGKEVYQMASEAGVVAGLKGAFEGLSASIGVTGKEMLQKFKVATGGMVTMKDAMMSFNKAAQLISTDFATMIPDAMGYLSKVSRATGTSLDYLLDSLVIGVGRLSPMILDNLSIQVSLGEASARAAEMFGVSTKALSKQQKQLGMANVVMEKLAINTAHMPGVTGTVTAAMASLGTSVKDVRTEIGLRFLPLLSEGMGVMNTLSSAVLPKLIPLAEGVANALMGIVEWVKRMVPAKEILTILKDTFGDIGDVISETLSGPMQIFENWFAIIKAQVEGITGTVFKDFLTSLKSVSERIKKFFYTDVGGAIMEVSKYLTYFFRVARDALVGVQALLKGDTERATKFFTKAFNTALATVIAMFKNFGGKIVNWGKQLIASYSTGIVEGIKTYLAAALQAVAGFIKSFMAPGSPPKFLPLIGTWGALTMDEYLKGMGEADYSMLSKYTGQFKTELSGLVDAGTLGADAFADTFFGLRGTVMKVMDTFKETGKVAAGALDVLPQKLGYTGEVLAELIEKQLGMTVFEEQLKEVAKAFDEITAAETELSSQVQVAMSEVKAGLAEVELQETALDLALQPFVNTLEKLKATEDLATAALREQFETGEIGLEEYEDRVKAARDQTKAAQQALNLEKANQVESRQALDTQKTILGLQEDTIRSAEAARQAEIDQQRAIVQEEAAAIQQKQQALAEEMATLESRLAFHRETLDIMKQQKQMVEAIKEAAAAATGVGVGPEAGEGGMPSLAGIVPEMPALEDVLPSLAELRKGWEEIDLGGPAFDLGEMLPDVEETKGKISEWFSGALTGIQTAVQQSPIAQWILDGLFVQMPKVVEGLRAWIETNFPEAYKAISTAFVQAMEGNWPSAMQTMIDYFSLVGEQIQTWWTENVQPTLDEFKLWWDTNWPIIQAVALTAWTVIGAVVSAVVTTLVETVWPPLQEAISNLGATMANFGIDWSTIWNAVWGAIKIVAAAIGAILLALVGVVVGIINAISRGLASLLKAFNLIFNGIIKVVAGFMVFFKGIWEVLAGIFTLDFPRALAGLKMVWVGFWTFIEGLLGIIIGVFQGFFGTIIEMANGFVTGIIDFFKNLYKELVGESIIPDMLSDIWTAFTDTFTGLLTDLGVWVGDVIQWFKDLLASLIGPEGTITKMATGIKDTIVTGLTDALEGAGKLWEEFKSIGKNLLGGLITGIKEKVASLKSAITNGVKDAIQAGKDALGIHSRSKVFFEMAEMSALGWEKGWEKLAPKLEKQMAMNVAPALMMGGATSPIAANNTYNSIDQSTRFGDRSVTMPVTVIGSKISLAEFKESLRQVLTERG